MTGTGVNVGDTVKFIGFADADELPDNAEALRKNRKYEVAAVTEGEGEDETVYTLTLDNPDFDDSKRASKNNPRTIEVEVFADEIEPAKTAAKAAPKAEETAPAKTKAKAKTAAKKPAAKKPAAKAKSKAPAKAKAKPAPKSKLKERQETDESEEESTSLEKGMILLQEHEEDQEVLTLISDSGDIIELAREQVEEAQHADYLLGGILYHVRLEGSYKEISEDYAGNRGFALFVEEELGVKYRKAMHLIEIYTAFSRFGIKGEVVGEVGWTKAMEISRVMDEDNADALVELARDSSVTELKDNISENFGKKGTDTREVVKRTTFKFRLLEESGAAITSYLEQAQDQLGMDNLDSVFEHIITQWATENLNLKKTRAKKTTTKKAA
jgi:hypothetical protein